MMPAPRAELNPKEGCSITPPARHNMAVSVQVSDANQLLPESIEQSFRYNFATKRGTCKNPAA